MLSFHWSGEKYCQGNKKYKSFPIRWNAILIPLVSLSLQKLPSHMQTWVAFELAPQRGCHSSPSDSSYCTGFRGPLKYSRTCCLMSQQNILSKQWHCDAAQHARVMSHWVRLKCSSPWCYPFTLKQREGLLFKKYDLQVTVSSIALCRERKM